MECYKFELLGKIALLFLLHLGNNNLKLLFETNDWSPDLKLSFYWPASINKHLLHFDHITNFFYIAYNRLNNHSHLHCTARCCIRSVEHMY